MRLRIAAAVLAAPAVGGANPTHHVASLRARDAQIMERSRSAVLGLYALYTWLMPAVDRFHVVLITVTIPFLAGPLLMASAGASMPWCLVVLSLSPWVTVVGYELRGHAHNARMLERLRAGSRAAATG